MYWFTGRPIKWIGSYYDQKSSSSIPVPSKKLPSAPSETPFWSSSACFIFFCSSSRCAKSALSEGSSLTLRCVSWFDKIWDRLRSPSVEPAWVALQYLSRQNLDRDLKSKRQGTTVQRGGGNTTTTTELKYNCSNVHTHTHEGGKGCTRAKNLARHFFVFCCRRY